MTACRFRSIPRSATGISHAARTTESTAATSCGRINGRDDMAAAGRARDRFAKTSYYAGQQSINWPPGGRGLKDRLLELARESVARVILGVLGNRRCCRVTRSWRGVRRPHVLAHEHRAHFGLS
jgi:hypothetical protein